MNEFVLPLPDDFHIHLRQDQALAFYAQDIAKQFGRILVMPNTLPPLTSVQSILNYKKAIQEAAPRLETLLSFKIHPQLKLQDLEDFKKIGVLIGKYYPAGATTNSEDGISDLEHIFPVLSMMEDLDIVLSVHGEEPSAFCLDREAAFIPKVQLLTEKFPKLRIVFEHLSSAKAVQAVLDMPDTVAATITVHHLTMTLDDLIGENLMPHHFCKPIVKTPEDREAIRQAAFSGNKKFFFGSDSAPHLKEKKESFCGAAGIYSAPVILPILMQEFEKEDKLNRLANFVAGFGADFYGIARSTQSIRLIRKEWQVPLQIHGVVPLAAGQTLQWSLA